MRKLIAFVLLCFVELAVSDVMAGELELDVLSFNIRYGTADDGQNHWNARSSQVMDIIRDVNPDIIGLQEALRFQIGEIKHNFPGYAEIGEGKEGGEKGEYSAILYRDQRFQVDQSGTFWLSETPGSPSKHWGNGTNRICTWVRLIDSKSKNALYVYNTHLDWESLPSRERSVRLISARIIERGHQDPFLLMGDFNSGENSPVIKYLKGEKVGKVISPLLMGNMLKLLHPLFRYLNRLVRKETTSLPVIDTFRALHANEPNVGTNHRFKGTTTGSKVDYIFVPPGTQVLAAKILHAQKEGRYPSDHFPVTARISYKVN